MIKHGKVIEKLDTSFLKADVSAFQVEKETETNLLVNRNENNTTTETDWVTTFLVPIIVVIVAAWLPYFFKRNKIKSEVSKLNNDVDKIKAETEMIRKSFQPYVLNTLQETQKKVLSTKLSALKALVDLSREYYHYETQYYLGESIISDEHDYYQTVYTNFGMRGHSSFQNFISKYEYIFPKQVINDFEPIKASIHKLYESNKKSESISQLEMT